MMPESEFRVLIDDMAKPRAGYLCAGPHTDADVPLNPGEDLPFEDRAASVITLGRWAATLEREATLHLLLECRRALKPGGLVRVSADDLRDLAHLAELAGLEQIAGETSVECRGETASPEPPALVLTKRDRGVQGNPLVSVLIPAYNPRFFAACLDSALAQTYSNLEIVVCDDSAGTEIETLVRSRVDSRVLNYERNSTRLRPRANFIRCLERSNGEFIKFLCDDDLLAPTCVASLLEAFRLAPDIALATSRRQRIDENGRPLADQPATLPVVSQSSVIAGYTLANAMIMVGLNTIGEPSTVLFRKADLVHHAPDYFGFDGAAGHGIIDMVTWAALLLKGDAVYLADRYSSFRIHRGQRQHDPTMFQRNANSIRSLQAAWLRLGLHQRLPPDRLLVKPFPLPAEIDWQERQVQGFAAKRIAPL